MAAATVNRYATVFRSILSLAYKMEYIDIDISASRRLIFPKNDRNEAADIDRKIIMSDPVMSAFITQAADEIGITADEYLDRFEELMDENPMAVLNLLHNEFRKRAEGIALPEDDTETE